jgi:glycosyltransferase involved in cell wall biosynthesis
LTNGNVPVSVIIPTTGAGFRRAELDRAIESVIGQHGARGVPLVVLNGCEYSSDVLTYLKSHSSIRFVYVPEAGVSNARLTGRRMVDTPFFAMLDDDDELLPNGVATCLRSFDESPFPDVVVGNGYYERNRRRELMCTKADIDANDLALAVTQKQWLGSGLAVFKSETVIARYFENLPDVLEWTVLALRLALELRVKRLFEPVCVIHEGTSGQVTASARYYRESPAVLRDLLNLELPAKVRNALRTKLSAALHHAASRELEEHNLKEAWNLHLQSLLSPTGIKYASFTRHLIAAWF